MPPVHSAVRSFSVADADAAVGQQVLVRPVGQAVPQVVVVRDPRTSSRRPRAGSRCPVPRLERDVVGHVDALARAADHERLDLGLRGVGLGLRDRAVGDADRLRRRGGSSSSPVSGLQHPHVALLQRDRVEVGVLGPVVAGEPGGEAFGLEVRVVARAAAGSTARSRTRGPARSSCSRPTRSPKTSPDAYGDCDRSVIGAVPWNGWSGMNLK